MNFDVNKQYKHILDVLTSSEVWNLNTEAATRGVL